MTIKKAFLVWQAIKISQYHKDTCAYLLGSRPEDMDCNCGLRETVKKREQAFEQMKKLILRRPK